MVEKEHLEAFTTAVDALSNNIGPLNTKTCEGVFAKARPLKGTDAEYTARKAMVARLMRALKRLSKGSKEAAEARHEFCVKLWEAQPDKLKNAITDLYLVVVSLFLIEPCLRLKESHESRNCVNELNPILR